MSERRPGMSLHHVGFVVMDINAKARSFVSSLAATWDGRIFHDPNQRVNVTFLSMEAGAPTLELIEPCGENSPVLGFLRSSGGGLHHMCYEVADLEARMAEMKKYGAVIARRPKPAVAFEGRRIAWVLTAEKLLIELLER